MNNWIDDGHGSKWHKCKLGADCGLKVIEAGKARCWCQDQEASRVEVQAARKYIENLETMVDQLERENAALREDKARLDWLCEDDGSVWLYNYLRVTRCLCRKDIDAARKEAQP